MLRTVRDLQRCSIADREGEVGSLYDVFFDNRRWVVRWFVLERRVAGGHVLVSPAVVNNIDWGALSIELDLTRDHIDNPENLETKHSSSRYFGNKRVGGCAYSGRSCTPYSESVVVHPRGWLLEGSRTMSPPWATTRTVHTRSEQLDLRSWNDVKGLRVQAIDGDVGELADLMVDESWAVRYVVVAGNGIDVQGVVVAVGWVQKIDWGISKLYLDMTRPQIYSSPKYRPQVVLRHG